MRMTSDGVNNYVNDPTSKGQSNWTNKDCLTQKLNANYDLSDKQDCAV